ncbi:MAG TPA: pitrilysin family protein [Bryobacteraceae bacterium]|jgi:zinc protease|nr:pitrilysin family protein [Bryobacteraceae bacterium]
MKPGLCLLCALLLAPALSRAEDSLPAGVTKVTSVEGITEYQLRNGLKLLVFPDASKPNVTVNITYLVGSRHEGSGEAGMAHLLEHMLFKGSPRHTNIPQELTEHGARPNGTTSWDRTNYFETFQATEENLRWALDLESDRMVNSFVKKEDLDKEFSVVRNEFEMGENNPFRVLFEHTLSAAFLWHSYGRSVIGNRSDIERVPIEKLQAFYHKFYQPDNAVLTVAGKVDEGHAVALVAEYFGKIPRPERVLSPTYTVEPQQDGERTTTVRRVGDIQAIFTVYHIPDGASADLPALEVLASILGEDVSGRLYKALVDNKKASQVFANAMQMNEPGILYFGALLNKTDSLDDARKTMLDTIDSVVKEPPSKDEVDRARTRILKDVDMNLRSSERVGLFISEYLAIGDWRMLFLDRDRMRKVTPEDVQRVAAAYLKPANRTVGEFIPDAKPDRAVIPPKTDVAALVKDYKGGAAVEAGEAFDPSPANIEKRTTRFTLPSGMKVSLLSKKTRGGSVHASIALHFGDLESLKGKDVVGVLAARTLIKGTRNKNRQQIQDEIDRLKAQIQVSGGATGANVSIETVKAELPGVLQLASEILKEATLPDTELEETRKQSITDLDYGKSEPQTQAFTTLNRTLYPFPRGDVRATMSPDEEIEDLQAAKLDEVRAFYKNFYGASNAELAVVGDFDTAQVRELVTNLFGEWKSPAPYGRIKTGFQKIAAVNQSLETPDKANAVFAAGERLQLGDSDEDYPALVFGNYMLGGGFLNSRLAQRIRVKDGLSYGIGSRLTAKSDEQDGQFLAFAIAAPQNIGKVEAAFREEIARALKDGFTQKETDADRDGWLQFRQVSRADDASLCRMLNGADYDNRTLAWDEELENHVKSLTPERVVDAMRKHIDPANVTVIKAGDFKKAAASAPAAGK